MFKQRKNKTFNYQSSFSKKNETDTNLDKSKDNDFVSKWKNNKVGSRKVKGVMPLRTFIIVLVLLLICMYLLDYKFNVT